jgi:phage terminase large subunit-like protein
MIELDEELSSMFTLYRDAIEYKEKASVYRVLSAEAYTKEGLNPSPLVIFDEVHAQPSWDLWNTLSLAGGARADSLLFGITTAGVKSNATGQDSLCYSLYQYGQKLVKGETRRFNILLCLVGANKPLTPTIANLKSGQKPTLVLEILLTRQDFESAVLRTPEAEFRTKRCNTFVSTTQAWRCHKAHGKP